MVRPCSRLTSGDAGMGRVSNGTLHVNKPIATIAAMGTDIGKNSFHVVGLDQRGAIVLRQRWSRGPGTPELPCRLP